MNVNDWMIYNIEEVRRRSKIVWRAIPDKMLNWKPDEEALTCAEMIRHVLQGEFLYHQVLIGRGSKVLSNISNPFESRPFTKVDVELEFAQAYHEEFIEYIKALRLDDLETVEIDRSDVGYVRTLGDMLLRIPYHESVHTGQLLDYMRTMGIDRPKIWD